jgi:hypothetical protein
MVAEDAAGSAQRQNIAEVWKHDTRQKNLRFKLMEIKNSWTKRRALELMVAEGRSIHQRYISNDGIFSIGSWKTSTIFPRVPDADLGEAKNFQRKSV